ncbi:hypothetical protein [Cupriavidus sp. PET2-C1]
MIFTLAVALTMMLTAESRAAQLAAKNASVAVLINQGDAFEYVRKHEASVLTALQQGRVLRAEFRDFWPTKDQTYHLDYDYVNDGGLALNSHLYVTRSPYIAKRVLADVVRGTLEGAKNSSQSGVQITPISGLEGWQQEVTAFHVTAAGRPFGIIAVFRRGANVAMVSVLGQAAPKNVQAFKVFMQAKADKMLGFVPEF